MTVSQILMALTPALMLLGGIVALYYKLGRLEQEVRDQGRRIRRLERLWNHGRPPAAADRTDGGLH